MSTVEHHARVRATRSREGFLEVLGGGGVLVRLDERGGRGDPTPWAFHAAARDLGPGGPPRDDERVNADELRKALSAETQSIRLPAGEPDGVFKSGSDEETATTLTPPPCIPAARGAASVVVIPAALGSGRILTLGRSPTSDVVIAEMSVSRVHAELRADATGFVLVDRRSSQGTRVNGRVLEADRERPLASGDIVELGDVKCLYLDAEGFWERVPDFMD